MKTDTQIHTADKLGKQDSSLEKWKIGHNRKKWKRCVIGLKNIETVLHKIKTGLCSS